jgi:hypothetical protein
MTNEIREHFELYEKYVEEQKASGMPYAEYDVWATIYLNSIKSTVVEKRKKAPLSEEIKKKQLQAKLIDIKNGYYDRLDHIIWGREKAYKTWAERQHALDDSLNSLRKKMWEAIVESGLS